MPTVIVFLDGALLNSDSEIHVFEDHHEAIMFSSSITTLENFRPHVVKKIPDECWHFDRSPLGGRSYQTLPHEVKATGGQL